MVAIEDLLQLTAETFFSMNFVKGKIHLKESNQSEVLIDLAKRAMNITFPNFTPRRIEGI
jgi:hypothetical protein